MSENSLSKFAEAVLNEAKVQQERQVQGLEERRKIEIEDIENELSARKQEHIYSEKKRMENESYAKISATKTRAFERLIHKRTEMFNEMFENVIKKIREYTKSEEYHEFLQRSLAEIMEKINEGNTICEVNRTDVEFMNMISKKYSQIEIVCAKTDFIGGFILKNSYMRLYVDNTLSRLIELEKQKFYKTQELMIEF